MTKKDMRPQELKQPMRVEVKTMLPWTIIAIVVALATGFYFGWTERSGQMLEVSEVKAIISDYLKPSDVTAKK